MLHQFTDAEDWMSAGSQLHDLVPSLESPVLHCGSRLLSAPQSSHSHKEAHSRSGPALSNFNCLENLPLFSRRRWWKQGGFFFCLGQGFLLSFVKGRFLLQPREPPTTQGPHLIQPPQAGDSRVSPTSFGLLVLLTQHHQRHLPHSSQGETQSSNSSSSHSKHRGDLEEKKGQKEPKWERFFCTLTVSR